MATPDSESTPPASVPGSEGHSVPVPKIAPDVLEAIAAKVVIRVSDTRLRAYISIQPPYGMANGDLKASYVERCVREFGIDPDQLDPEVVKTLVDEWNKTHATVAERQAAETAYLPVNGENARIDYAVDPSMKFKPPEQGGNIDFKNLSLIKPVKKGQPLARKIPATKGAPGVDLFGKPCNAEEGKDRELPMGKNTEISETNPMVLVASVAGFLQRKDGLLTVNECFVVEGSVDYSTGNITYDQSAIIKEDVSDGFTITLGGALEVGGAVGEAKLIVGGDVLIKKGFVGAGNGLLTAKGNVHLGFSSNQTLRAHGNILIEKESFNCQISSRKSITVFGPLVGGQTMAFEEIQCRVAGNDLGTKTELEAGLDYILNENKLLLEEKLKELSAHLVKINQKLRTYREVYRTRKRFTSNEAKLMLELRDMQEKIQTWLPELEKRKVDTLEQIRLGYQREGICLHVEKKVHPGVVIKMGSEVLRIQEEMTGPKVFAYSDGRIKVI